MRQRRSESEQPEPHRQSSTDTEPENSESLNTTGNPAEYPGPGPAVEPGRGPAEVDLSLSLRDHDLASGQSPQATRVPGYLRSEFPARGQPLSRGSLRLRVSETLKKKRQNCHERGTLAHTVSRVPGYPGTPAPASRGPRLWREICTEGRGGCFPGGRDNPRLLIWLSKKAVQNCPPPTNY